MENQTNNNWNVPLPTHENVMKDKNFNYNILAKTMLESNRNDNPNRLVENDDMRYIYKNKFKDNVESYFIEGANKIAKKTFDKHWRYIRKVDFNLVTTLSLPNGTIYKLNYKDDNGRSYVTIPSETLNKLIECCNLNVLKTYLILKYTCNTTQYTRVSQAWLCEKIGFSKNSRNRMKVILDFLKDDLKLIDIKIVNGDTIIIKDKEVIAKNQYIKLLEG